MELWDRKAFSGGKKACQSVGKNNNEYEWR